jgi:hypothetical protein
MKYLRGELKQLSAIDNGKFCYVAAAAIGASLAGGIMASDAASSAADKQSQSAKDAADAQLTASREANALQERLYNQGRADNEPWRNAGMNALARMNKLNGLPQYAQPTKTATRPAASGSNSAQTAMARPQTVQQKVQQQAQQPQTERGYYADSGEWRPDPTGNETRTIPQLQQYQAQPQPEQYIPEQATSYYENSQPSYNGEDLNATASSGGIGSNVGDWYKTELGRNADPEGQAYWESQIASGKSPEDVHQDFLTAAQAGGATINGFGNTNIGSKASDYANPNFAQSKDQYANPMLAQSADRYANANFSDPASRYANTDIGSASSEYRNPDLTTQFSNTDFKSADSEYANPELKNMLANFSMADFEADPGLQYRMDQGNKSVESSAASKGSQLSGATLKALARFGQNEGSAEYNNAFNRFRTQKLDQYGQAVDDFGRTEGQRQEKYAQRGTQYGLNEAQRANQLGLDTSNYARADTQRLDQYGQRVDKFNRDETQRLNQYGQRVDEFGRLEGQRTNQYDQAVGDFGRAEGQRIDQYGQAVDQYGRNEAQRMDKYGQATDLYNRNENQRVNKYGIANDTYAKGVADDTLKYNRLAGMAGIGQTATGNNATLGTNYGNQVSANTTNAANRAGVYGVASGDAQASGALGSANALGKGLNSAYGQYKLNANPSNGSYDNSGYIGGLNSMGRDFASGYNDYNYG